MMDLDLRYSDLLTFCPQWEDIFVGYCRTLEEVFALYTTVLAKLAPIFE